MKIKILAALMLSFSLFTGFKYSKPEGNVEGIALHAAKKSMVLIKNDNILPISQDVKTIAVIGGALQFPPFGKEVIYHSLLKDLGENVKVKFLQGSAAENETQKQVTLDSKKTDEDFTQEAIDISKEVDLVLVFAGTSGNVDLPENQNLLIEACTLCNNNVVVILSTGQPAAMPWKNNVEGIITMWFGDEEIATALTSSR